MTSPYRGWLAYDKSKASVTPQKGPLKKQLLERQIPRSQQSLRRIQSAPVREIAGLLSQNCVLCIVFCNIVQNAYLMCTISDIRKRERLYDF